MSPIGVSARRGAPGDTDADTRIVGLFEGDSPDDPALKELVELPAGTLEQGEGATQPAQVAVGYTHGAFGLRQEQREVFGMRIRHHVTDGFVRGRAVMVEQEAEASLEPFQLKHRTQPEVPNGILSRAEVAPAVSNPAAELGPLGKRR